MAGWSGDLPSPLMAIFKLSIGKKFTCKGKTECQTE